MEAERTREEHSRGLDKDWAKSRSYSNNMRKESFVKRFFSTPGSTDGNMYTNDIVNRVEANVKTNCGQSPKRKIKDDILIPGSPAKKQKFNKTFSQNLSFWKCKENYPYDLTTDSIVRTKMNNISQKQITSSEVVRQKVSPGGLAGNIANKDTSGELSQP